MDLNKLRKKESEKGFTLIELMIVVAIIGILAAIAIPNFLGMQEKAKRRSIQETASSARSELQSWMDATLKNEKGVIDMNGDGVVNATEGPVILISDIPTTWIAALMSKKGETQWSPWFKQELFQVNTIWPGIINLSQLNNNKTIMVIGYDSVGSQLYRDSVSVN